MKVVWKISYTWSDYFLIVLSNIWFLLALLLLFLSVGGVITDMPSMLLLAVVFFVVIKSLGQISRLHELSNTRTPITFFKDKVQVGSGVWDQSALSFSAVGLPSKQLSFQLIKTSNPFQLLLKSGSLLIFHKGTPGLVLLPKSLLNNQVEYPDLLSVLSALLSPIAESRAENAGSVIAKIMKTLVIVLVPLVMVLLYLLSKII